MRLYYKICEFLWRLDGRNIGCLTEPWHVILLSLTFLPKHYSGFIFTITPNLWLDNYNTDIKYLIKITPISNSHRILTQTFWPQEPRLLTIVFFLFLNFIYLLAVLGLCCWVRAFYSYGKWGLATLCLGVRSSCCGAQVQ